MAKQVQRTKRAFTPEFKYRAVLRYRETGQRNQTAKDLGIAPASLREWEGEVERGTLLPPERVAEVETVHEADKAVEVARIDLIIEAADEQVMKKIQTASAFQASGIAEHYRKRRSVLVGDPTENHQHNVKHDVSDFKALLTGAIAAAVSAHNERQPDIEALDVEYEELEAPALPASQ